METNKEFLTERVTESRGVESSGEYVLPDYLGDVKKLLLTAATPTVMEKYKNGDSLDVSGVVKYDVIYEDSEGVLTPATFTTDFDVSLPVDDGYVDSVITADVIGAAVRLKGPRKISVRSRIDVYMRAVEKDEYRVEGDAFSGGGIITDSRTVEVRGAAVAHGDDKEYREELGTISGAILDEVVVLGSRAEISSISVDCGEDSCEVSCDVLVEALVMVKGEMPHTLSSKITFITEIPSDSSGMDVTPIVSVRSLSVTTEAAEDGVAVIAGLLLGAECIAEENTKVRIITDCYSTERELVTEMGEFNYTSHIGTVHLEDKMTHTLNGASEAGNIRNVLFLSATPELEIDEYDVSGAKVGGKIRFSGIACQINDDGGISYEPFKAYAPYESNVKYSLHNPDKTSSIARFCVNGARCDISDGRILLSGVVSIDISFFAANSAFGVTSASVGEVTYSRSLSVVTVYYPTSGDTLFDVAKTFHTSPARIARDNELSDDVFSGGSSRAKLSSDPLIIR